MRPAKELHQIKAEDTPAARRIGSQPASSTSGVKKMPPPVPLNPASRPSTAPVSKTTGHGGKATAPPVRSEGERKSRRAEKSKTIAKKRLKPSLGKRKLPPSRAAGMEQESSGNSRRR